MLKASDLPAARAALNDYDISVIVCNTCLDSDTWVDVLNHVRAMPHPPSLIVTSRLADDRLWAEALNLGAWDVLSKPFDRSEVVRSVRYAWEHWRHQVELPARPKVLTAAS
jgi:DNA-binding NtrC family response regulator